MSRPEGVRTKENETPERHRPRFAALLRPLVAALLLPLKWLFRVMNRRQRARLAAIPGIQHIYRSILPWLLPKPAQDGTVCSMVSGLKMYLDSEDNAGGLSAYLSGEYEPATTRVVVALLRPGDVAVDVGAHWGYFTLLAATLCEGSGRVFAFEPHPRNYELLRKNISANGLTNVVALQKAVANHTGTAKLFQARSTSGHSLCGIPFDWASAEDSANGGMTVETVALDDFFAQTSAEPRLIKMDIEGAEPLALAGMQRLIERNPSLVLISEFNPLYLGAKAAAAFLDQLFACGFDVAVIDDQRRQLAVGPKAAILERGSEKGATNNLLATRDRSLFERLLQQHHRFGKHLAHLEMARL